MDIVSRVKNILMSPKTEWPIIAVEPTDVAKLYIGYIIPLSAIPPLAGLVGMLILGLPLGLIITSTIVNYIISLVAIFVFAFIAGKLAAMFGGRDDMLQGLKWLAYSGTAGWVGGIFLLIPILGSLIYLVFAIYGLYLLYLGTTPTMSVPQDRAVVFILAFIAVGIVLGVIIFFITNMMGMRMA
jgi:hypothetical protein